MNILDNDTIVALATPSGGAIGVIRLSGPSAIAIANNLFCATRKDSTLLEAKGNTLQYGVLRSKDGEELDDVVVSVYRAPHSYTGEDCVEISCHGSAYILQQVLQSLVASGARQANPGEYTLRAYLNGKMDLSQAEAVADIIAATNKATHKLALSQLKGHFSGELEKLRAQLLKLTSLIELELDFSDHEELEFADRGDLKKLATAIHSRLSTLARSFETGAAIKKGIPVAIIGKTNVGKSTLLNKLLHEDKAIVSDVHGTTRDVIEDTIDIHGVTFRFIDTAGLRKTQDRVERIGIERTYHKMSEAAIILWVVDTAPTASELEQLMRHAKDKKIIIAHNKIDLSSRKDNLVGLIETDCSTWPSNVTHVYISAKHAIGLDTLEQKVYEVADIPEIDENSVIVTNTRHYEALTKAKASVERLIESMDMNLSGDLLAEDLRQCLDELAEITGGSITSTEVIHNIFNHFCIGK